MMITKTLCTFALTAICLSALQAEDTTSLRVMTLNLYHGGTRLGQPLRLLLSTKQAKENLPPDQTWIPCWQCLQVTRYNAQLAEVWMHAHRC